MTALTYLTHAMSAAALIVLVYALVKLSRNREMRPVTIPALAIILLLGLVTFAISQTSTSQI
jgi:lipopolysaccharide export LptBFGC system permease protein LptF